MSHKKKQNSGKLKKYIKLQIINIIVYLSLFLIFSAVCSGADVNKDYMPYVSLTFIGLASFISGFIAGIKERKNGLFYGLINALPLNGIFIIISLLCNGFSADIILLACIVTAIFLSALGGIVSVNVRLK